MRMCLPVLLAVTLMADALPCPAAVAQTLPISEAASGVSSAPRHPSLFELKSDDGSRTIRFKGRIQIDSGWVSDSARATSDGTPTGNRFGTESNAEVRSVQLGIQGEIGDHIAYKTGYIHVPGASKLTNTYIEFRDADFRLTLGQSRAAASMEEETGSTNLNFMERAAFTDAWNFRRRLGAGFGYETDHVVIEAAIQTDNLLQDRDERDRYAASARAIVLPIAEKNRMIHLGIYAMRRVRVRDPGPGAIRGIQYDQRPEIHPIDQHFVDTGLIPASGDHVIGIELAGLSGPFNATAEASVLTVHAFAPGPRPRFQGGYIEVGYFLTGETRRYNAQQWLHVAPKSPVGSGGFGAIQVVLRLDYVDLESKRAGIYGGRQMAYLLGLNWHPIDQLKLMADFGLLKISNGPNFRDAAGNNTVQVVGLRGQIYW
jgi:phosphate-selective porin OprO/OprP